jgi:Ni,Fe-hydrogenase I cytochrome b subunit
VFTAAVLLRLYWMFAGNAYARWSEFIPVSRRRFRSLWNSLLFYSFLRREPEHYPRHNALAAGSYAMIFGVFLLIVTGLVLYASDAPIGSPLRWFAALAPWFWRAADGAADPSRGYVDRPDIRHRSPLLRDARLDHRTRRNIRFDLFRL